MEGFIGALVGGAFAMLGVWLGPLTQSRQDHARWLREQRAAVYVDACLYLERLSTGGGEPDGISARLALIGHKPVVYAWLSLMDAMAPDAKRDDAKSAATDLLRECRRALYVDPRTPPPSSHTSVIASWLRWYRGRESL